VVSGGLAAHLFAPWAWPGIAVAAVVQLVVFATACLISRRLPSTAALVLITAAVAATALLAGLTAAGPTPALLLSAGLALVAAVLGPSLYLISKGELATPSADRLLRALASPRRIASPPDLTAARTNEEDDGKRPSTYMQRVPDIRSVDNARDASDGLKAAWETERIPVRVKDARRTGWGWEFEVENVPGSRKTPSSLNKAAPMVEAGMLLRRNGLLVQPHPGLAAVSTVRVILSDPWIGMPAPMDPHSPARSDADRITFAYRLDGKPLSVSLAATHVVVLAASGGGKSVLLRILADGLGFCPGVTMWDLDPTGLGQAPQAALFRRRALSKDDCTVALADGVTEAEDRTRQMGRDCLDKWPGDTLAIILDEFPRLPAEAKASAIELLRIGRKAKVVLIFASQDNTKDVLGDAISGQVAFKALGPGVQPWQTSLAFGPSAEGEGWSPGRLQPEQNGDPRDAGTFFVQGAHPDALALPAKVLYLSAEAAAQRAAILAAKHHSRPATPAVSPSTSPTTWNNGIVLAQLHDYLADDDRPFIPLAELTEELSLDEAGRADLAKTGLVVHRRLIGGVEHPGYLRKEILATTRTSQTTTETYS
jgi:hypothetical protein